MLSMQGVHPYWKSWKSGKNPAITNDREKHEKLQNTPGKKIYKECTAKFLDKQLTVKILLTFSISQPKKFKDSCLTEFFFSLLLSISYEMFCEFMAENIKHIQRSSQETSLSPSKTVQKITQRFLKRFLMRCTFLRHIFSYIELRR